MQAKKREISLTLALLYWCIAPAGAQDRGFFDIIKVSHPDANTTIWRIDQPNVGQEKTRYPQIQFHPGDVITINAGGCVQTGGSGKTWKSYTNPLGDKADHLYSGTIYIPDVIPSYTRIGGQLNKSLHVPQTLPPTVKQSDLFLYLGYQDDKYSDNGYYSHDDGTFDQCKNVGAAWVEIRIVKGGGGVSTNAVNWTPYSKPFDVAWDWSDRVDVNGLPVNPYWAYQIEHHGQAPDFEKTCGGAFSGGDTINTTTLSSTCTSQSPTADISNSSIRGWGLPGSQGYCSGKPLSGHLDWYYVTFTGLLYWDSWSGTFSPSDPFEGLLNDDDMNFQLLTTGNAGLTIANNETVGLEFQARETIDNFSSPFWKTLRDNAEKSFGSDDSALRALVNGKFAVVTGLMGIDGVHDGYTEIHPVMSMAICISGCSVFAANANASLPWPLPTVYGTDQTWVYFVNNYGSGGGCSQLEHAWPGLSDGSTQGGLPSAWYFIALPWEPGATSVNLTSHEGWAPQAINGSSLARWGDWAYFGFQLSVPEPGTPLLGASVDGQITIHYNGPPGARTLSAFRPPASVRGHAEEGVEWSDVQKKIVDPALRARLNEALRSAIPARVVPHPHTVRIALSPNPGAAKAVALITSERRRLPTRDRPYVDTVQQKQRADLEQILIKLLPPRPARPIAQPPQGETPIARPAPPRPPTDLH